MKNFIIILLTVTAWNIYSQEIIDPDVKYVDYSRPKKYIIADIKITGVKYLQPGVLVNLSGLKVGQEINIPGDDISKAIEKFWSHGLFSDVKILVNKIEENLVFLEIFLTERPRLSKLNLHGINKSETKDIEETIQLKAGSQVTDNIINNTKTLIKNHFISKGFLNVDVQIVPKEDTSTFNKVDLDVFINKNKKVKIGDIIIEGNNVYSDARLRRIMKKTKKKNLNIFKNSKYIDTDFKEDKESLISFYNKNGYRDAKIT
jgi:outer membrane protein insertion porin family